MRSEDRHSRENRRKARNSPLLLLFFLFKKCVHERQESRFGEAMVVKEKGGTRVSGRKRFFYDGTFPRNDRSFPLAHKSSASLNEEEGVEKKCCIYDIYRYRFTINSWPNNSWKIFYCCKRWLSNNVTLIYRIIVVML